MDSMDSHMSMVMEVISDWEPVIVAIVMNGEVRNPGQSVEVVLPSTEGYQDPETYYNSLVEDMPAA